MDEYFISAYKQKNSQPRKPPPSFDEFAQRTGVSYSGAWRPEEIFDEYWNRNAPGTRSQYECVRACVDMSDKIQKRSCCSSAKNNNYESSDEEELQGKISPLPKEVEVEFSNASRKTTTRNRMSYSADSEFGPMALGQARLDLVDWFLYGGCKKDYDDCLPKISKDDIKIEKKVIPNCNDESVGVNTECLNRPDSDSFFRCFRWMAPRLILPGTLTVQTQAPDSQGGTGLEVLTQATDDTSSDLLEVQTERPSITGTAPPIVTPTEVGVVPEEEFSDLPDFPEEETPDLGVETLTPEDIEGADLPEPAFEEEEEEGAEPAFEEEEEPDFGEEELETLEGIDEGEGSDEDLFPEEELPEEELTQAHYAASFYQTSESTYESSDSSDYSSDDETHAATTYPHKRLPIVMLDYLNDQFEHCSNNKFSEAKSFDSWVQDTYPGIEVREPIDKDNHFLSWYANAPAEKRAPKDFFEHTSRNVHKTDHSNYLRLVNAAGFASADPAVGRKRSTRKELRVRVDRSMLKIGNHLATLSRQIPATSDSIKNITRSVQELKKEKLTRIQKSSLERIENSVSSARGQNQENQKALDDIYKLYNTIASTLEQWRGKGLKKFLRKALKDLKSVTKDAAKTKSASVKTRKRLEQDLVELRSIRRGVDKFREKKEDETFSSCKSCGGARNGSDDDEVFSDEEEDDEDEEEKSSMANYPYGYPTPYGYGYPSPYIYPRGWAPLGYYDPSLVLPLLALRGLRSPRFRGYRSFRRGPRRGRGPRRRRDSRRGGKGRGKYASGEYDDEEAEFVNEDWQKTAYDDFFSHAQSYYPAKTSYHENDMDDDEQVQTKNNLFQYLHESFSKADVGKLHEVQNFDDWLEQKGSSEEKTDLDPDNAFVHWYASAPVFRRNMDGLINDPRSSFAEIAIGPEFLWRRRLKNERSKLKKLVITLRTQKTELAETEIQRAEERERQLRRTFLLNRKSYLQCQSNSARQMVTIKRALLLEASKKGTGSPVEVPIAKETKEDLSDIESELSRLDALDQAQARRDARRINELKSKARSKYSYSSGEDDVKVVLQGRNAQLRADTQKAIDSAEEKLKTLRYPPKKDTTSSERKSTAKEYISDLKSEVEAAKLQTDKNDAVLKDSGRNLKEIRQRIRTMRNETKINKAMAKECKKAFKVLRKMAKVETTGTAIVKAAKRTALYDANPRLSERKLARRLKAYIVKADLKSLERGTLESLFTTSVTGTQESSDAATRYKVMLVGGSTPEEAKARANALQSSLMQKHFFDYSSAVVSSTRNGKFKRMGGFGDYLKKQYPNANWDGHDPTNDYKKWAQTEFSFARPDQENFQRFIESPESSMMYLNSQSNSRVKFGGLVKGLSDKFKRPKFKIPKPVSLIKTPKEFLSQRFGSTVAVKPAIIKMKFEGASFDSVIDALESLIKNVENECTAEVQDFQIEDAKIVVDYSDHLKKLFRDELSKFGVTIDDSIRKEMDLTREQRIMRVREFEDNRRALSNLTEEVRDDIFSSLAWVAKMTVVQPFSKYLSIAKLWGDLNPTRPKQLGREALGFKVGSVSFGTKSERPWNVELTNAIAAIFVEIKRLRESGTQQKITPANTEIILSYGKSIKKVLTGAPFATLSDNYTEFFSNGALNGRIRDKIINSNSEEFNEEIVRKVFLRFETNLKIRDGKVISEGNRLDRGMIGYTIDEVKDLFAFMFYASFISTYESKYLDMSLFTETKSRAQLKSPPEGGYTDNVVIDNYNNLLSALASGDMTVISRHLEENQDVLNHLSEDLPKLVRAMNKKRTRN